MAITYVKRFVRNGKNKRNENEFVLGTLMTDHIEEFLRL